MGKVKGKIKMNKMRQLKITRMKTIPKSKEIIIVVNKIMTLKIYN